jgi:malonyl-CoA O-methyltransferase
MSSILRANLNRSASIARAFGARAASYEGHAALQRRVADGLARILPAFERPRILELGCGTGLFSRQLAETYPGGQFLLTDLSPAMLAESRRNLRDTVADGEVRFEIMDASWPTAVGQFDLIAMSMTLHWLPEPVGALRRLQGLLSPNGALVYATIGGTSFPEWREVLAGLSLPSGLIDVPELPGVVHEERIVVDTSTFGFLQRMKAVGGLTPKDGYRPLSAAQLRRAIRVADIRHSGRITWHIVYGTLGAIDP